MDLEIIILFLLIIYFIIGFLQFIGVYGVKKLISKQNFPKKDFFVSVFVPIKEESEYLEQALESVCQQDFDNFEVLFIAEKDEDSACNIARKLTRKYDNARLLISGKHDSMKIIAKSHNLIFGVQHAKGDVYLFTDSDVIHSNDWIKNLTSPLDEKVDGKVIHATTAPFFSIPQNFLGGFTSLSTNFALFLSSYLKVKQQFPSYASGASLCIKKETFIKAEIEKAWKENFNDDLVFACTLIDKGFNLFNVRKYPNYPKENFGDWSQLNKKMRRWMLTVGNYMHKSFRLEAFLYAILNIQFQITFLTVIVLGILNYLNFVEINNTFLLIFFMLGYFYSVTFRFFVARTVNEKNIMKYILLTPISYLFWGDYYLFTRIFYKSFSWGGHEYRIK